MILLTTATVVVENLIVLSGCLRPLAGPWAVHWMKDSIPRPAILPCKVAAPRTRRDGQEL